MYIEKFKCVLKMFLMCTKNVQYVTNLQTCVVKRKRKTREKTIERKKENRREKETRNRRKYCAKNKERNQKNSGKAEKERKKIIEIQRKKGREKICEEQNVSGATSIPGSIEREEGEETNKYIKNICNAEHAMLTCNAGLPKNMSKPFQLFQG